MAQRNKGNGAKRAAKKHAKELKRKKKLAGRKAAANAREWALEDDWVPAIEGLEGLAKRLEISVHEAAWVAESIYEFDGRDDAADAWLPSRVDARGLEGVVEGLRNRGVVVEEAQFAAWALKHLGVAVLAELELFPQLSPTHSVHDRDFCRLATELLWREWVQDLEPDEAFIDAILDADDAEIEGDSARSVPLLLSLWEQFGGNAAPARPIVATHLETFVYILLRAFDGAKDREALVLEYGEQLEQLLRVVHATGTADGEFGQTVEQAVRQLQAGHQPHDESASPAAAATRALGASRVKRPTRGTGRN